MYTGTGDSSFKCSPRLERHFLFCSDLVCSVLYRSCSVLYRLGYCYVMTCSDPSCSDSYCSVLLWHVLIWYEPIYLWKMEFILSSCLFSWSGERKWNIILILECQYVFFLVVAGCRYLYQYLQYWNKQIVLLNVWLNNLSPVIVLVFALSNFHRSITESVGVCSHR